MSDKPSSRVVGGQAWARPENGRLTVKGQLGRFEHVGQDAFADLRGEQIEQQALQAFERNRVVIARSG